jgi:serine/threonine protein kinase
VDRSGIAPDFYEKYELKQVLGTGAFATVKLCTETATSTDFAVKVIDKRKAAKEALVGGSSSSPEAISKEVQIMKQLQHPHVLRCVESFDSDKKLAIILELVKGGDLFEALPLQAEQAVVVVAQMADALWYASKLRLLFLLKKVLTVPFGYFQQLYALPDSAYLPSRS